jgi:uncharacterized membrane protein YfcA
MGLTGAGGGALMTPLLLLFGLHPASAISSDLVATLAMRPLGVLVHARRHHVDWSIVRHLSLGSVPGALVGTWAMGRSHDDHGLVLALGAGLVASALAMVARTLLSPRRHVTRLSHSLRSATTVLLGFLGGSLVGATSIGAGSVMLVVLVLIHPSLTGADLVGTDLAQAVPLGMAAALGAIVFGHVAATMTLSVVIGGVPGTLAGSLVSSRLPPLLLRPIVVAAVAMAGLDELKAPPGVLFPVTLALFVAAVFAARHVARFDAQPQSAGIHVARRQQAELQWSTGQDPPCQLE